MLLVEGVARHVHDERVAVGLDDVERRHETAGVADGGRDRLLDTSGSPSSTRIVIENEALGVFIANRPGSVTPAAPVGSVGFFSPCRPDGRANRRNSRRSPQGRTRDARRPDNPAPPENPDPGATPVEDAQIRPALSSSEAQDPASARRARRGDSGVV